MQASNKILDAEFLLYTRTTFADNEWVFKSRDQALVTLLETNFIRPELGVLPENAKIVFCGLGSYFILMIAEKSPDRVDNSRRPINQRAFFAWKGTASPDEFTYKHLVPLFSTLRNILVESTNNLPEDIRTISANYYPAPIELNYLEKEFAVYTRRNMHEIEELKSFSARINWEKDVFRNSFNVETPKDWTFEEIACFLPDISVKAKQLICVGKEYSPPQKLRQDHVWILSGMNGKGLSIVDKNGDAINTMSSKITPAILRNDRRDESVEVRSISNRSDDSDLFLKISEEAAGKDEKLPLSYVEQAIGYFDGIFSRKSRAKEKNVLLTSINHLQSLLIPVTKDSPEIRIVWTHLLDELYMFYGSAPRQLKNEWRRHLEEMQIITVAEIGKVSDELSRDRPEEWVREFGKGCRDLINALIQTNSTDND